MHDIVLKPGWDTFAFALVFIGLLVIGFFRLDEVFTSNKRKKAKASSGPQRPPRGVDSDGSQLMSDPDGRVWRVPPSRK